MTAPSRGAKTATTRAALCIVLAACVLWLGRAQMHAGISMPEPELRAGALAGERGSEVRSGLGRPYAIYTALLECCPWMVTLIAI